ncbi:MAG: Hpt domain-containing protein [Aestuariivirga sp.]|uniref:Hpt domain-containing protein n=1 Tax=Aestuariivirga sp. TaxID=2650926 RepID=UPI0025C0A74A|nr:Hpt domain-containing protein [Aestuariivirga sp.]MCA3561995.1 Hpt domain-containing protein [Aestuariivirga sp.]
MANAKLKPGAGSAVFDRLDLEHNTMHDQQLAVEVLGLFLAQLPVTLQRLDDAATAAEWKFAAHALKGASGAVGAQKLQNLAACLETLAFPGEPGVRLLRLQGLRVAAAEFAQAAGSAYPLP